MRESNSKIRQGHRLTLWALGAVGLLLATGLLITARASASYEQVADFGKNELLSATGLAVNTTGAGGVPVGTVYAVGSRKRVVRFGPSGEFREAWGWGVGNGAAEFQRCGPDGEAVYPTCKSASEVSLEGEGAGQFAAPYGVAVEQSTGRVYVLDGSRKSGVVQVFSADGSELAASFGERGVFGESFDEGPGKIHLSRPAGIAAHDGGVVYVTDWKPPSPASGFEDRVMVFEAGVYAGRERDIAASPPAPEFKYAPFGLAVDDAGNLYTLGEDAIYAFSPADRLVAACEFKFPAGGLQSLTVDPASGAPFFFSSKGKKEIHQLSPCNGEGEFEEVGTIPVSPLTSQLSALAFNPVLSYGEGRPTGILYGADGTERPEEKGIGHIYAQAVSLMPAIEAESVSGVGVSSAVLAAEINPKGASTSYVFQYLTETAYQANGPADRFAGASEAPSGEAQLGNGLVTLAVSVAVSGLAPDTAYRFRVLATNSDGTSEGVAEAFRTYPSGLPALPEGRGYERVTPAEKHSGEPFPLNPELGSCGIECKPGVASEPLPRQISTDGSAIVYSGFSFTPDEGAAVFNEYLSRRTATGWQTANLSPALMGSNSQGYRAFKADLSQGILYQGLPPLAPSAPSGYANLYLQPSASPTLLGPLLMNPPLNRPLGTSFSIAYAGASADFSHHFFAANDALPGVVPAAVDGGVSKANLYEYVGGELRLVNVQPGNATTIPGAFFGARNPVQGENSDLSHAISDDGSRVFWSSESGQVYVRKDGATTEEVPDPSGRFLTASADGTRLLLTNGLLYDVDDLSDPPIDLSEGKGGFLGIGGQGRALSKLYFLDTAVLNAVPNDQGAVAQPGKPNLYAWQEGAAPTFVATLLPSDSPGGAATTGTWTASPTNRLAEASPDGNWLAFLSKAPLIDGFENVGPCELKEEDSEVKFLTSTCRQVYLYDAASGALSCPSCNPSGEAPHGPSTLPLLASGVGRRDPQPQPSYLSDSGRLFFDSQDALSSRDVNGNVEDAYQFVPNGIAGCGRTGGCVSLISSGTGPDDSNFLAADPAGQNAFFTTRDRLVPSDHDDLFDVYDARVGGGFASETEGQPGECQGEGCQPSPPAPAIPTPGSSSYAGPGNPRPPRRTCPKGKHQIKVKGKKKCVPNKKKGAKSKAGAHKQATAR